MQQVNDVPASELQALIPIATDSAVRRSGMKLDSTPNVDLLDETLHIALGCVIDDGDLHLLGAEVLMQDAA
jgi:hypothetical protein